MEKSQTVQNQMIPSQQGAWKDLALHTIGWKAFQDLCGQICEVLFNAPTESFRETGDQGLDGFLYLGKNSLPTILQCKYSSVPGRTAALSDLTQEDEKIKYLINQGNTESYIFMTNCSLSADMANKYRSHLREMGFSKPHILGKQYIIRAIRSSNKLRALVPQVYGLGDLSAIMDARKAEQTAAILGHWKSTLHSYVPTRSHRSAVEALMEHGIVLLLGNPATGKSTLAAVLTTLASESEKGRRFKVSGAKQLMQIWNPNEKDGFYWVDDAFGANQLRDEYVGDWAEGFEDLAVALNAGNKFVLTSRRHIYMAAKPRLGTRNLHALSTGNAVVKVDEYSDEEKSRILYNLIKFGKQPTFWKTSVKHFLGDVAKNEPFVPGVIKRLADPVFTKRIPMSRDGLLGFLREPETHLIDVISELRPAQIAALSLIFVHNGTLPRSAIHSELAEKVEALYGVEKSAIEASLVEMTGSFVEESSENTDKFWIYEHPTILDAVTEYIRRNNSMLELFVEGASINTLLSNVVCDGSASIRDAMVLPKNLNNNVVRRIVRSEDILDINKAIFGFIARRSSNEFLRDVIGAFPNLFKRSVVHSVNVTNDVKIIAAAKAHRIGLLENSIRIELATLLEASISSASDSSILESDLILNLIEPKNLLRIGGKLIGEIIPNMSGAADQIGDDADLDIDPDDVFSDLQGFLDSAKELFEDCKFAEDALSSAEDGIDDAHHHLRRRQEEKEKEEEEEGRREYARAFGYVPREALPLNSHRRARARDLFDDVDE
jgi:energy-coupling factor transporter ATP-binding protein EcfA2